MFKLYKTYVRLAAICLAGVTLNIVGVIFAKALNLTIYLDAIGTVFIAALGGYVPGIAVGFLTNLIGALFDSDEIYYGTVSILLAIMTTFFAGKGYYDKFPKILLTIPAAALITTLDGTIIEETLRVSNSWDNFSRVQENFLQHLYYELSDKSLAILISFLALKFIPQEIKENFKSLGKMQAPVSREMRRAMNSSSKFISSLRTKMLFNLMAITLFVAGFISVISYTMYQDSIMEYREY